MKNETEDFIYCKDEIVDIECPKCGCKTSYKLFYKDYSEGGVCTSCGELTYTKLLKPMNLNTTKISQNNIAKSSVTCPYCHSTNTKKISKLSKASSVALFGIFSIGKVSKEWHCNNCNSNF